MKFLATLCLFLAGASALEIKWNQCVPDSAVGLTTTFEPYPVRLVSGQELDIKVALDILKELDGDLEVQLKMAKKGALFNLPIPCLEISEGVHLGSCNYKVADLLANFGEFLCPNFAPEGQECSLPLRPGTFGGEAKATLPQIPANIARLAKGTILITANIQRVGAESVACVNGAVQLTNK